MAMSAIQVPSLSAHVDITSNLEASSSPRIVCNHGQNRAILSTKEVLALQHTLRPHM